MNPGSVVALVPLAGILLISGLLVYGRPPRAWKTSSHERLIVWALLAVAVQCLHFVEEFVTGFYVHYPRLLGLDPWTPSFFVAFNLGWIAIWCLAVAGLQREMRVALVPIWFLALASVVNAVAHPGMAVAVEGYFPGLWTSPVCGVVGVVLVLQLRAVAE